MPHRARDPIAAAAQMIIALQTTATRTFDIFDPVVITVGKISGGTKRNVIPDTAMFEATVRRYSEENEQLLDAAIRRTLEGVAGRTAWRWSSSSRTNIRRPSTLRRGRVRGGCRAPRNRPSGTRNCPSRYPARRTSPESSLKFRVRSS